MFQAAPPLARFRAMKRAKSSSQAAWSRTKASNVCRRAGRAFFSKAAKARARSGRFHSMTAPEVHLPLREVGPLLQVGGRDQPFLLQPLRGETRRGFPAKAEKHW